MKNAVIQSLARQVRYRNIQSGGWPGKPLNATAVTRFPNILAEVEASGMWLWCPAQHANVSVEVMAAVLEDGEELTIEELRGLCRLYGSKPSYMVTPTIQMVDPDTNKGKARRRALADLIKQTEGLDYRRWMVESAFSPLNSGEAITYASYRWAVGELQDALDRRAQRGPRTSRRTEV